MLSEPAGQKWNSSLATGPWNKCVVIALTQSYWCLTPGMYKTLKAFRGSSKQKPPMMRELKTDLLKFRWLFWTLSNCWGTCGVFIPSNTFQGYGKACSLWVTPPFLDIADRDQREETVVCCNSIPAGRRLHAASGHSWDGKHGGRDDGGIPRDKKKSARGEGKRNISWQYLSKPGKIQTHLSSSLDGLRWAVSLLGPPWLRRRDLRRISSPLGPSCGVLARQDLSWFRVEHKNQHNGGRRTMGVRDYRRLIHLISEQSCPLSKQLLDSCHLREYLELCWGSCGWLAGMVENTGLSLLTYLTFFILYTRHVTHLTGIMRWLVGWTLRALHRLYNSTLETVLWKQRGIWSVWQSEGFRIVSMELIDFCRPYSCSYSTLWLMKRSV